MYNPCGIFSIITDFAKFLRQIYGISKYIMYSIYAMLPHFPQVLTFELRNFPRLRSPPTGTFHLNPNITYLNLEY